MAPHASTHDPGMDALVLVLNCGSSSIKAALFDASRDPLPREPLWRASVRGIDGASSSFAVEGGEPEPLAHDDAGLYRAALERIRKGAREFAAARGVGAVAHRVVHGGGKYAEPVKIDAAVLADLRRYIPLAPLHQPFALDAIELLLQEHEDVPQVACFDTAFHRTQPRVEQLLALPHALWDRGLRRYGFHGASYAYMAVALEERHGAAARGRTIVAHLGSGASLCAMKDLRSVATTMGFSALDGLMMGTRCGSLDPGALLYLMEIEKRSVAEVAELLYHHSGLLGVSGMSGDPAVLLEREAADEHVRDALALYVHRMVREVGALVAVLGGLDMLVFTAGVGEHSAPIRARVCEALAYLGVSLDGQANQAHRPVISNDASRVRVGVEPTNEEWIIASQARALLRGALS